MSWRTSHGGMFSTVFNDNRRHYSGSSKTNQGGDVIKPLMKTVMYLYIPDSE